MSPIRCKKLAPRGRHDEPLRLPLGAGFKPVRCLRRNNKRIAHFQLNEHIIGLYFKSALQDQHKFLCVVIVRLIAVARTIALMDHRDLFRSDRLCRKWGRRGTVRVVIRVA